MTDYKQALKEGFDAAKKAEIARTEIKEVLDKLKSDLREASDGKLLVEVRELEEPTNPTQNILMAPDMAKTFARALGLKMSFEALVAVNPMVDKSPVKVLAKWKQSKDGYPCSITWNKQELQCEDHAAVEEGLAELLRDPYVGEQLYQLTRLNEDAGVEVENAV